VLLTHNRPIVRPVDDSIVRLGPDGVEVLRRARGFAPLPLELHVEAPNVPTILAAGGHLKNTVALALGRVRETHHDETQSVRSTHPTQVVMSAHVGDLDTVLSVDVFRRAVDDLLEFFQASPEVVVCDLHPDYASTRHAEAMAACWNVPLLRVQHHHTHVAACMAEYGLQGRCSGSPGTAPAMAPTGRSGRRGVAVRRRQVPSGRASPHIRAGGGDRAVHEPRRSALGILFEILGPRAAEEAVHGSTRTSLTRWSPC